MLPRNSPKADQAQAASTTRDEQLAAEAKKRARDQHHWLRSETSLPKSQGQGVYQKELRESADSTQNCVLRTSGPNYRILNPPPNFSVVIPGIYRSSFPKKEHFDHLGSIRLKSILTLVPEEYPEANARFVKENGIRHFHIGMPGNKEPFVKIPAERILAALRIILDRRNHPILIHCNKGKHRTGCLVGCFRKLQNWALASIFEEYRDHAAPKSRVLDEQFIDLFDERCLIKLARNRGFVPGIPAKIVDPLAMQNSMGLTNQEHELERRDLTVVRV